MRILAAASLVLLTSVSALSQSATGKPGFEVASIKPNISGHYGASTHVSNGEVILRNASLKDCIELAFHISDNRLAGPDWLDSQKFDIVAKPPSGSPHDQYREMMQALLADRFKLVVHREPRVIPVFALVVGKNGAKLEKGKRGDVHVGGGRARIDARGVSLTTLADELTNRLDRPVVDRSGLEGVFNFTLEWTPEESQASPSSEGRERLTMKEALAGPSLFKAVQEQLGLRLEAGKLPLDVVVVDHVEKAPTEN